MFLRWQRRWLLHRLNRNSLLSSLLSNHKDFIPMVAHLHSSFLQVDHRLWVRRR